MKISEVVQIIRLLSGRDEPISDIVLDFNIVDDDSLRVSFFLPNGKTATLYFSDHKYSGVTIHTAKMNSDEIVQINFQDDEHKTACEKIKGRIANGTLILG